VTWDEDAHQALDAHVAGHTVLTRISAAKRLRDLAEQGAREAGETRITKERVEAACLVLTGAKAA
jgi:chlorophyllide a reductase subunit Z